MKEDPALLEWEQGRQIKLRVFPIEPRADREIHPWIGRGVGALPGQE